jgi:hypothetical protein
LQGGGHLIQAQNLVPKNPFTYMRDGKFYFQEEEFHQLACNYLIASHLNQNNDFIVSPSTNYRWEGYESQETASKYLHAHFKLMKEMGINTVRIMNASVTPRADSDLLAIVLYCDPNNNPDPVPRKYSDGIYEYKRYMNLNNGGLDYLKQSMKIILEIAAIYDLKVIWVTGVESRYFNNGNKYRSLLQHQDHTINNQYKNLMLELCNEFKYDTILIAYDLFHELESFANQTDNINKISVANSVNDINSVIKNASPNQMTTAGLFNINTFFKLGLDPYQYVDFYNFHMYEKVDEQTFHNLPQKGMSVNRILYYFSKNGTINKPWMIGENGIETHPTSSGEIVETDYSVSESVQRQTANNILNFSAACGSLGYTYWEFANELGWQNYGLMKYKGVGHNTIEINTSPPQNVDYLLDPKIIVTENQNIFKNFNSTTTGGCVFPANRYYDLLLTSGDSYQTWEGVVTDENSNPIQDAIVKIRIDANDHYTFTNSSGYYQLTTPTALILGGAANPAHSISVTKSQYTQSIFYNCFSLSFNSFVLETIDYPNLIMHNNDMYLSSGQVETMVNATMIPGNIHIETGAELIVDTKLFFSEESKIIINPGGKLTVKSGAVLSAIHNYWEGIEAVNDNNTNTSVIRFEENSVLSKARNGIITDGDVVISVMMARFLNNGCDIFTKNNTKSINVAGTEFLIVDNYYNILSNNLQYFIILDNCVNASIIGSKFEDQRSLNTAPIKGGILANDSRLNLNHMSIPKTTGYLRNSFSNLLYGIQAHHGNLNVRNTDFTNNLHDINASYLNETNLFEYCNFKITDNAPIDYFDLNYFVQVSLSNEIKFFGCNFEDVSNDAIEKPIKTGIKSFNIKNMIISPSPIISSRRCEFNNLQRGIYAINGQLDNKLTIKQTDFICSRSIYAFGYNGFNNLKIINNNINTIPFFYTIVLKGTNPGGYQPPIPIDPPVPDFQFIRAYGVFIDGLCGKFQIEGNNFYNAENSGEIFGIVHKNNGLNPQQLYRNNFYNLENAVQSIGRNKNSHTISVDGLQILCNNFNNIKNDIYVTRDPSNSYYNHGIALSQGSLSTPAANLFTNPVSEFEYGINNYEMTQVNYYYRNSSSPDYSSREYPQNVTQNTVNRFDIWVNDELSSVCTDKTGSLLPGIGDELVRVYSTKTDLEQIDNTLSAIVDGGNTELTVAEIVFANDNDAWQTYLKLMQYSPYLSDTVLKDVAKKEYHFTPQMIRNILVSNPQAAKSKGLQKVLNERINELPDYMLEQINSGLTQVSPREYLEYQKLEKEREFNEALFNLLDYYNQLDEKVSYKNDSIVKLLKLRDEYAYKLLLAEHYYSNNKMQEGESVLYNLKYSSKLSDFESADINYLIDFYSYYNTLTSNPNVNILALDSLNIVRLQEFEAKGGITGDKARVILLVNNASDYMEPVYLADLVITPRSARESLQTIKTQTQAFAVYPNPASEHLNVEYDFADTDKIAQLVITDKLGRIVYQQQLLFSRDIVIINTEGFTEANYTCTIYVGNTSFGSAKFTVKR